MHRGLFTNINPTNIRHSSGRRIPRQTDYKHFHLISLTMGEHLFVHGPLCSCHHVPTLLSFSDRIKQCNSGKFKKRHQGSSAVNYMGHLEEKNMTNTFYGTWATSSPKRKTDSKVTGKDHEKPCEKKWLRNTIFYTECKHTTLYWSFHKLNQICRFLEA